MAGLSFLAFFISGSMQMLEAAPEDGNSESPSGTVVEVVQPYEIYDVRFCRITPAPFVCRRCLDADEQFVRILRRTTDGALFREYACRPFQKPYVQ